VLHWEAVWEIGILSPYFISFHATICQHAFMVRLARVVVPGIPHHVTQRGNRREPIFFTDGDRRFYRALLGEQARRYGVAVWAYCLMPNHVHLILTPSDETGLARAIGETHRRYANFINVRNGWSGHLFQNRFSSVAMDEDHLIAAVRYVSLNPVRARLVARAEDWAWSSVNAHLAERDDDLVSVAPVLDRIEGFAALLETAADDPAFKPLRAAENTGRPVGSDEFIAVLERRLDRPLAKRPPGRKKISGP
jgi:putative transposase